MPEYEDYPNANDIDLNDKAVIGVVANGEREAVVMRVPKEAIDGNWTYRVFPTLQKNRILVAVNSTMIDEREQSTEPEDLLSLQAQLIGESLPFVVKHFEEQDIHDN